MRYSVKNRIKTFRENTTVTDTDFTDWEAVNTGTANVQVNKITLEPGQGLPYKKLQPNVVWESPIQIVILAAGGEVTLTQLIYKEVKEV